MLSSFVCLVLEFFPLYAFIAAGYLVKKATILNQFYVSKLMIYFITPTVVLKGVENASLSYEILFLPVLVFLLCTIIGLTTYKLFLICAHDSDQANLIPLSVGSGNTGYFGIPIALLVLGEEQLPVYIICMLGTTLFESSVGFYMAADRSSFLQGLRRVLKIPILYAFFLGLVINFLDISFTRQVKSTIDVILNVYTIIGMMLIGMNLSSIKGSLKDIKFTLTVFFGKFVVWPVMIGLLILLDYHYKKI